MRTAIANRKFTRSDTGERVKPGQPISGEREYIEELGRLGLVRLTVAANQVPEQKAPLSQAAGTPSSASPAAQASPKQTSSRSGRGGKKGKAGE